MYRVLIGNAILLAGCALMVCVGLIKQRRRILIVQSVQMGIQGLGNVVLGGISGGIANGLGIVRNLICLKREFTLPMSAAFVAVQAGVTFFVDRSGPRGWLPVLATAIFTFAVNTKDEVRLKTAIICAQVCWFLYDLSIRGYVGAAFDVFTICSNLWGILSILHARKKERERG